MGRVSMVTMQLITTVCFIALVKGSTNDRPRPRLDREVVGVYEIDITDAPYQVSLQYEGFRLDRGTPHFCGGSIISDKWVLTSFACINEVHKGDLDSITVQTGSATVNDGNGRHTKVSRFISQSDLESNRRPYVRIEWGLALLELASPLMFDSTTQPVKLPAQNQVFPENIPCLLSGWDTDTLKGSLTEVTNFLRASVLLTFDSPDYVTLAGIPRDSNVEHLNYGDNGAPLVANGTLIGVACVTHWSSYRRIPGRFARTSSWRSWIKENTGI